jgi:hypothetical protein
MVAKDEKPAPPFRLENASWWTLIRYVVAQWLVHKDARQGAALAYYSVFSLGPLIVIAIAIAGLLFGQEAVRGEVSGGLKGLLGDTGAQAIDAMLASAGRPREGIVATVIGLGALALAAIGVVVQLKDALNTRMGGKGSARERDLELRSHICPLVGRGSFVRLPAVDFHAPDHRPCGGWQIPCSLSAGSRSAGRQLPRILRCDQPPLRNDVQMAAGRKDRLE